ncbi:MAG: polymer-forming cytoskeletal protein [Polyangiaceae bacterium]|nr:polymer-forming cytoskeletal protein [Polyangiaceae bacterium]
MAKVAETTVIGRATFVRGRVIGTGDLEIAGRIEGEIQCSGEALVDTSGLVAANINAQRIVVRGAVRGDLVADESVHVEAGAKVVGNLRAPRIAIASGGLVRGHVQTGSAPLARPIARAASAATPSRAATTTAAHARPAAQTREVARETVAQAGREVRTVVTAPAQVKAAPAPTAAAAPITPDKQTSRREPPPPVVPVLKKGTKAVQKKR